MDRRGGKNALVSAGALWDAEGHSSRVEKDRAVGHPSGSVGLGQVCGSSPWPGGMGVDAFGNAL